MKRLAVVLAALTALGVSPAPSVYDFTGVREMDRVLDLRRRSGCT